jgi:hypothetical protein
MNKVFVVLALTLVVGSLAGDFSLQKDWVKQPFKVFDKAATRNETNATFDYLFLGASTVALASGNGKDDLQAIGYNYSVPGNYEIAIRHLGFDNLTTNTPDVTFTLDEAGVDDGARQIIWNKDIFAFASVEGRQVFITQEPLKAPNATAPNKNKTQITQIPDGTTAQVIGFWRQNNVFYVAYQTTTKDDANKAQVWIRGVPVGGVNATGDAFNVTLNGYRGLPARFTPVPDAKNVYVYALFSDYQGLNKTTQAPEYKVLENVFDLTKGTPVNTNVEIVPGLIPNNTDLFYVWSTGNTYGAVYYNNFATEFKIKAGFNTSANWTALPTTKDTTPRLIATLPFYNDIAIFWNTVQANGDNVYTYQLYKTDKFDANGTAKALATNPGLFTPVQYKNGAVFTLIKDPTTNDFIYLGQVWNSTGLAGSILKTVSVVLASIVAGLFFF